MEMKMVFTPATDMEEVIKRWKTSEYPDKYLLVSSEDMKIMEDYMKKLKKLLDQTEDICMKKLFSRRLAVSCHEFAEMKRIYKLCQDVGLDDSLC